MIYKCPCCGTEYFQFLSECDWCPSVKPVLQPREPIVEEEQAAA